MATYTAGTVGTAVITTVASQVDTVNFGGDLNRIEVVHLSGTDNVWYTLDGSTPAVNGDASYVVPPSSVDSREPQGGGATQLKLVSAGVVTLRVQRGN